MRLTRSVLEVERDREREQIVSLPEPVLEIDHMRD